MLPKDWDADRLEAEEAVLAVSAIQSLIRKAAAQSLANSDIRGIAIGEADVRVRIRMVEEMVFIAVGATGISDPKFFAVIFSSFKGVPVSDWAPEPGGNLDIAPISGEILWAAPMSPSAQQELLDAGSYLE